MASGPLERVARYDDVAAWYRGWSAGWSSGFLCDPETGFVPERLDGQKWLDVACGTGRTAREIARRGASVIGVDLSAGMLEAARAEESFAPMGIGYLTADITRPDDWWDGTRFDGGVCEMALMDIDDLSGTVSAVGAVLRRGGHFFLSLVHPCCPRTASGLSSWSPDAGYHAEGYWTSADHDPDGVRSRVGSNHRTLSTYVNTFLGDGFVLEELREPLADVPMYLTLSFRRA